MITDTDTDTATTIVQRIVDQGLATKRQLRGCRPWHLARLRRRTGVELPALYRFVLRRFGRGAGRLFEGVAFYYPTLLNLNDAAVDLYEEESDGFRLPDDAIVILLYQSSGFAYMVAGEGDDPPVYEFQTDHGRWKTHPCLSGFLIERIDEAGEVRRRIDRLDREYEAMVEADRSN